MLHPGTVSGYYGTVQSHPYVTWQDSRQTGRWAHLTRPHAARPRAASSAAARASLAAAAVVVRPIGCQRLRLRRLLRPPQRLLLSRRRRLRRRRVALRHERVLGGAVRGHVTVQRAQQAVKGGVLGGA